MTVFKRVILTGVVLAMSVSCIAQAGEKEMTNKIEVLENMYDRFNARDIDGVLEMLTDDVIWANGMDNDYVHGRDGVRQYWTSVSYTHLTLPTNREV